MPTFGADPDAPDNGWEERTGTKKRASNKVYELVKYFGYHRSMRMSQRFGQEDKAILSSNFSRLLSKGFTTDEIKSLVDRFYSSPYSSSEYPALMFCKKEVQEELSAESSVLLADVVAQWLLDGMPNNGPFMDTREVRRAVLLVCDESVLRYPELVVDIIRIDDPEPYLSERLSALEDLISWNLGDNESGSGQLRDTLSMITLPQELASPVKSPKSMKKKHSTVKQAVLSIKSVTNKERW
jgi:hypothetical protein